MTSTVISSLRALSRRHLVCGAIVVSLSLIVNSAIALHNGIPQPRIEDEFSYLLAADTFAHGRLTNPTPPFPEHFETPHVLVRPTYMSKYPPGQGLALAIGQVMSDQPIIGVWISSAAAAAAIYWMLLGFLPGPWALAGGIAAAIHPQMLAWSQVHWGGSVAVFGGALLVGSWGRLMDRPAARHAIVLAIGLIVLANSRPFEGLVLSVPLVLFLLMRNTRRWLWPAIPVLAIAAIAMGYYNARITGHALRLPFIEYSAQYDVYPKFWFLPKHPEPNYSSDAVAQIHTVYEQGDYDRLRTPAGLLSISAHRLGRLIWMFTRPMLILLLPLLAGLAWARDPILKWIWITLAIFFLGLCAENWFLPDYAAPVAPIMFLLIMAGWTQITNWNRFGKCLSVALAIGWSIATFVYASAPPPADSLRFGRADLIAQYPRLRTGKHLIFVKYGPGHLLHDEWVYNSANLQDASIIWARDLGQAADEPIKRYFHDRQDWLLEIDGNQLRLNRYPPSSTK